MRVEAANETCQGITIRVASPSRRYMDEFIKLTCAPDLLALKLFPDSKEITETMAAYNAVRKFFGSKHFSNPNIVMMDVGSGKCPRTAAFFAFMTKWRCIAIDPQLRNDRKRYDNIDRLSMFRGKVQDVPKIKADVVVVCAVHAHVGLDKIVERIEARRIFMVAIPCCQPLQLERAKPNREYQDHSCWSPHRTVKVYDYKIDPEERRKNREFWVKHWERKIALKREGTNDEEPLFAVHRIDTSGPR